MRNSLYSLTLTHDSIYKDVSVLPTHCVGYIITHDKVRVSYSDDPALNTLLTSRISQIVSDLRTSIVQPPQLRQKSQTLLPGTIMFEQCDINTLITLYSPLLQSLARNISLTTDRYSTFTYDDLLQDACLIVTDLYRKGYYVHGNLIKRAFINFVRLKLRKEPTHYSIISLSTPQQNKHDDDSLTLEDTLVDDVAETILDDIVTDTARKQRIAEQRDYVLTVISPRTYDQLIREYRTNTVPTGNGKLLQDIRRQLGVNINKKI